MSGDLPGAGWDPPFDELNFGQTDLNSPSAPEAGCHATRAPGRGAVRQLAAWAVCSAAWGVCSAAAEREQEKESAEAEVEPEQAPASAGAGYCLDPDAAQESKTLSSRRDRARAGSPRILSAASSALHVLLSGLVSRHGLRQFR